MRILLIYYSRTGVTRKVAERMAERLRGTQDVDVTVEEIVETKDRRGLWGFLGGGVDAMRKRAAAVKDIKADVPAFDVVVIGTPIWAWTVTPAVRVFCEGPGRSTRRVAFYCTMGGSGAQRAFEVMEQLCGKAPLATVSFIDRHVRKDSEGNFTTPAGAFCERLLAAMAEG